MNQSDLSRNSCLLCGSSAQKGYMSWWHSFRAVSRENGADRVFFIEYLVLNPGLEEEYRAPGTPGKGKASSYAMIRAGVFAGGSEAARQFHAFFPVSAFKIALSPLVIQLEECFYSENHIYGCVEMTGRETYDPYPEGQGRMEWDLEVCKTIAFHTGRIAGPMWRRLHALASFWHGEGIRTDYRGTVILDGEAFDVAPASCGGYADRRWGSGYDKPWLQFASCCLSSASGRELKNSALALCTCQPVFLGIPLKSRLLLQLTYEGEDFECGISLPKSHSRGKWKVRQTQKRIIWQIVARSKDCMVKVTGSCLKEEMLPLCYEKPRKGSWISLLSGGSATGTVLLYRRTPEGNQLIDTLTVKQALCIWGNLSYYSRF